jgi:hypothetical protein
MRCVIYVHAVSPGITRYPPPPKPIAYPISARAPARQPSIYVRENREGRYRWSPVRVCGELPRQRAGRRHYPPWHSPAHGKHHRDPPSLASHHHHRDGPACASHFPSHPAAPLPDTSPHLVERSSRYHDGPPQQTRTLTPTPAPHPSQPPAPAPLPGFPKSHQPPHVELRPLRAHQNPPTTQRSKPSRRRHPPPRRRPLTPRAAKACLPHTPTPLPAHSPQPKPAPAPDISQYPTQELARKLRSPSK